jgi:hypothetical protein
MRMSGERSYWTALSGRHSPICAQTQCGCSTRTTCSAAASAGRTRHPPRAVRPRQRYCVTCCSPARASRRCSPSCRAGTEASQSQTATHRRGRTPPRPSLPIRRALLCGPDHRAPDPLPGREHFYRRHVDPRRWLRVVVDFNEEPAWVVTALVQQNPPRGWKS